MDLNFFTLLLEALTWYGVVQKPIALTYEGPSTINCTLQMAQFH